MALQKFVSSDPRLQLEELRKAITYASGSQVFRGAEAIANAVGGIALLYYVPGVRQLADLTYRLIARNRNYPSASCDSLELPTEA